MGSFIGHAIPGSFFFIAGVWWIVAVLYRYLRLGYHQRNQFKSSPTFSVIQCRFGQIDIESVLVVFAGCSGLFVEIFAACLMVGRPIGYTNMQHTTMYLSFALAAVASIARPKLRTLSDDVDKLLYLFLTAAFMCEGLLFKFHLFGRHSIDVTVHSLLLYSIWLAAAMTLGEMVYRDSVLLALGRGFFTVLQGTWFWQAGFILYNPLHSTPWDEENHHQLMLIACMFTWHIAIIIISALLIAFVMSCVIRMSSHETNSLSLQEVVTSRQPQYSALANEIDDPFED